MYKGKRQTFHLTLEIAFLPFLAVQDLTEKNYPFE